MKKNILITGGSGFIGRNISEFLQKKYHVFTPRHSELELLDADRLRNYIRAKKIDIIIHSAIVGGGKEDSETKDVMKNNLRIFFSVAKNSELVEKIIYFGSGLEYDKSRSLKRVGEEDFGKKIPHDDYGLYKYVVGKYIESSKNIYDLVLFGIYGKYEDYVYRFISNAIVKNLLHLPIVIMKNAFFDYLYIEDLFPIVEYFIQHKGKFRRYNAVTGKRIDLLSLARLVNKTGDFKSQVKVLKKGLNLEYTANNARLTKEIRKLTFTPHRISVKKLYNWYRERMDRIDIDKVKKDPHLTFLKKKGTLYK